MENILVIDTETTGLSITENKVIEIGAIMFNIPSRSIVAQCSTLLYSECNEAYEINRIEIEALKRIPTQLQFLGMMMIVKMIDHSDAIIAHNAEFDRKFIEETLLEDISKSKKWICTKNDVVWPVRKGCPLNLIHIAVDLEVPVVNAHRALNDCKILMSCIEVMDDIEYFLEQSGKGRLMYHAHAAYEERQIVKDNGFQWNKEKKIWYAKLTEEQAKEMPFMCYQAE